jgi:hypothetical protein
MALVSLREYARHRRQTLKAVQKAIASGRIRTTADGKIDVDQADAEWARNTGPKVRRTSAAPKTAPPRSEEPRPEPPSVGPSYAQSRAIHEAYEARLAKLTYEERIKKLINADEMRVAAFNLSRMIRDRVLNVPDRVVGAVLAEVRSSLGALGIGEGQLKELDMAKVHGILLAEVRNILEEFADELGHR